MTVVETVLVFVGAPAAILGAIALLTLWPKFARAPRYRPGQQWTHEPVWWTANREALPAHPAAVRPAGTSAARRAVGGARGTW